MLANVSMNPTFFGDAFALRYPKSILELVKLIEEREKWFPVGDKDVAGRRCNPVERFVLLLVWAVLLEIGTCECCNTGGNLYYLIGAYII